MSNPFAFDLDLVAGKPVVISGIRDAHADAFIIIDQTLHDLVAAEPSEIRFGCARGVDTMAAVCAYGACRWYRGRVPRLSFFPPGQLSDQPEPARNAVKLILGAYGMDASLHENAGGPTGDPMIRNKTMLEPRTMGIDLPDALFLIAFTDDPEAQRGGTAAAIRAARKTNTFINVVIVRRTHGGQY